MDVNAYAQVCGLHWSQNANEIVSTHGYNSNCIQLWKAPTMECLGTFPGHATRVVYLAASPDGQSIATGSGLLSHSSGRYGNCVRCRRRECPFL